MYLLRTRDATLHHFSGSKGIKYAILSHVWADPEHENSFLDLVKLAQQCERTGQNPRDLVCDKIRDCCIFAERAGYDWTWIDTCCIDQASSAELSESINSMFTWYADADVCYAYLYDVGDEGDPREPDSQFCNSRWFKRGWTLQELIAPTREIFLSQTWHTLGSKHMLAHEVEQITGIDRHILTHKRSLDTVSVAQRMSWAARRQTTRVEDRAYSLLGIFGINIPTIYGEGELAFIRLQEEILRRIPDQTIFAWGRLHSDVRQAREVMERDKFGMEQRSNDPRTTAFDTQARLQDLLAPSPSEFASAAGFRSVSMEELATKFRLKAWVPQYSLTSSGIQFSIPLSAYSIESWKSWMARTGTATTQHVQLGLLACENADRDIIVLFLRRANHPSSGPQYAAGEFIDGTEDQHYHRGAVFPKTIIEDEVEYETDEEADKPMNLWQFMSETPGAPRKKKGKAKSGQVYYTKFEHNTIYVHHRGAAQAVSHLRQDGTIREIMATRDFFTFTIPTWLLVRLGERHGLLPMRQTVDDSIGVQLRVPFKLTQKQVETGALSIVSFADPLRKEKLTIIVGVGQCTCIRIPPSDGVPLHKIWVDVRVAPLSANPSATSAPASAQGEQLPAIEGPIQTMPNCKRMHVDFTMVRADDFMIKTVFGDQQRRVEIEFRKWEGFERIRPIMCQTHVITLDLKGPVYERLRLQPPKIWSYDEVPLLDQPAPEDKPSATDGRNVVTERCGSESLKRTVRFLTPSSPTLTRTSSEDEPQKACMPKQPRERSNVEARRRRSSMPTQSYLSLSPRGVPGVGLGPIPRIPLSTVART